MATEAQILANPACRGVASGEAGPLYICRESSTNQLLFMQNKPNLVRRRRIANPYNTKDYENKWWRKVRKNKPNSNPIKPNLKRAKMNINLTLTKDYRKKYDFVVRINQPKTNPISNRKSEVRCLSSVLCFLMQPKLLNFHHKNSLTVGTNSVK